MNNPLKLQILNKAEEDLIFISNYIAKDNPAAAKKILKYFYAIFDVLSMYPNIGKQRIDFTHKDVKFYVVKKNYLILYKSDNDYLYILRVFSSYSDICSIL